MTGPSWTTFDIGPLLIGNYTVTAETYEGKKDTDRFSVRADQVSKN
tara:strand:+ start:3058 stop:3195 length:138 start_codon:yes stop_codon:yes gene_type:complete